MENRQITIIAISAALAFLLLIFACSRGCNKTTEKKIQVIKQTSTNDGDSEDYSREDKDYSSMSSYGSSSGGSSGSYYDEYDDNEEKTPPPLISEEEKLRMKKFDKEEDERMRQAAAEWLQEKLADKSISAKTREQYLLKANQSFNDGMLARKRKDYRSAIKHFNNILQDEKATPITKYFALYNLMGCAQETKDLELFFIAARLRAKLVATEDLSIIGIEEKNTDQITWCNKVEAALKAKDNPAKFDEAVRLKIAEFDGELEREKAEASVKRDIEFYTKLFKDFYE